MTAYITAHMIVKNEDQFIWYAIASILPFVDRFLLYDTGSTDETIEIIKSFTSNKIEFKSMTINDKNTIDTFRQRQLEETDGDWVWIVDGDEIYPSSLCREIRELVAREGSLIEGIVVRRYELLGDIFHYQDESVGSYDLFGKRGHFVLRLINKKGIPGLHLEGTYPYEGYYDSKGREITSHAGRLYPFTEGKLFHACYLRRSSSGGNLTHTLNRNKMKVELGKKIRKTSILPEVFYAEKPSFVPDATKERCWDYELAALIVTPIKLMKRSLWKLYISLKFIL